VRLVDVLHENIPEEVDAYHPAYWPGEIYLDQEKTFFKALHGGQLAKGSILSFLNPFSQVWKNAKQSKHIKESNFKGDGLTMGGLIVVSKAGVHYQYQEKTFGDRAPLEEVLAAAKEAVAAAPPS